MIFTLPWRGRVGERSEPGWGELHEEDHPLPTAIAIARRSTSPLQGEVKKTQCGMRITGLMVAPLDDSAAARLMSARS
jgi:hypothetical protein